MVQVKATKPIPCTGEDYILVNQFDAWTLGWTDEVDSHFVEVATAPLGYQFPNQLKTTGGVNYYEMVINSISFSSFGDFCPRRLLV